MNWAARMDCWRNEFAEQLILFALKKEEKTWDFFVWGPLRQHSGEGCTIMVNFLGVLWGKVAKLQGAIAARKRAA